MTGCPGVYDSPNHPGNPHRLEFHPNLWHPYPVHHRRTIPQQRRIALALLAALLPMITYFGHWPSLAIPLPGADAELTIPFASGETASSDHHQHCHGAAAECASGPGSLALAVTILAAAIALAIPGGPLRPLGGRPPHLRLQFLPRPEPAPPRASHPLPRLA